MRLIVLRLAVAVAAATPAVAAAEDGAVHAIVLVDVVPEQKAAGQAVLAAFVGKARRDPDLKAITLINESRSNHFILDETFAGEAARRRFAQKAYVRDFRTALFPHLGSPWDERIGAAVSP